MKTLIAALFFVATASSIYSVPVTGANGNSINLSNYQGKKILIVNIATGGERVGQLATLQQMQQQYSDSLVVLAFPSNSFGKESRTNAEIIQFCQTNYDVTFPITAKGDVKGTSMHPLYQWLTRKLENGVMDQDVKDDFQKFLISGSGELIGVFAGSAAPDHPGMIQAIEN